MDAVVIMEKRREKVDLPSSIAEMQHVEREVFSLSQRLEEEIPVGTPGKADPTLSERGKLSLSLKVANQLLYWDTWQDAFFIRQDLGIDESKIDLKRLVSLRAILKEAINKINSSLRELESEERFHAVYQKACVLLEPIDRFAKEYTLFLASNAHIDMCWLWRWRETREVCRGTFLNVVNLMEEFPDFYFSQSQAQAYRWMEDYDPPLFSRIKRWIEKGRWEIVGGMWVEPDCNLIDGESWVRQLLYGKRYFQEKLGVDVKIAWIPDSFGYNWNIPQFYRQAGIDFFITQKIGWNDTNVFPYHLFWWEALDGSRVLTYFPYKAYNLDIQPGEFVRYLKQFEVNSGLKEMLILYGMGDHGGGPTSQMLDRVKRLGELPVYPQVKFCTTGQYLGEIQKKGLDTLPVWNDDLYLEYHRGTFTTQSQIKQRNSESESLLTQAEVFSCLAALNGFQQVLPETVEEAWKKVLFNQFHDTLSGSCIRSVYADTEEDYTWVREKGEKLLRSSIQFIADNIDTSQLKKGKPLVVFNPLSWKCPVAAKVKVPGDGAPYTVLDDGGRELPSQLVEDSSDERRVLFTAENVGGWGYHTYNLLQGEPTQEKTQLQVGEYFLENSYLRIELDEKTGLLARIFDKEENREILVAPRGNLLQLLEDKASSCASWNIVYTGRKWELDQLDSMEVIEYGPVRATIRVRRSFLGEGKKKNYGGAFEHMPGIEYPSSFFTQDIILYHHLKRVDFRTEVDWWEDHLTLKVAFPVDISVSFARYGIPWGSIKRSTRLETSRDKARFEVPAMHWADLSQDDYGVSLLSRSKYGYDIVGQVMRLSLLRSPTSDDPQSTPDPIVDRGKHTINYALYPHAGNWKEGRVIQGAYEFNTPPLVVSTTGGRGNAPISHSGIKVRPDNIIITGLKKLRIQRI